MAIMNIDFFIRWAAGAIGVQKVRQAIIIHVNQLNSRITFL